MINKRTKLVDMGIKGCLCLRCKHKWQPRKGKDKSLPKVCPKCKSPYWQTKAKKKKK